jgi:ubiquinone/menaquinone biosynthesis C-methylase UbiE
MIPEENKGEVGWAEHYVRYIFAAQFVKNKIVLDIACGSGFGTHYLAFKGAERVVGVDVSEESINYAKRKYSARNVKYLVGDCENIPLPDKSVDLVVSFETLEHVKGYEKFLAEVKRISTPGALFILSTPNKKVFPKGNLFHIKEFNHSELTSLLSKYFKTMRLFYQHDWFSSAVLDKKNTEKESIYESVDDTFLLKLTSDNPLESLYYVALASDGKIPIGEKFPITIFSPFIDFKENLATLVQKAEVFQEKIKSKEKELRNIYQSRTWRWTLAVRKIKKSIPLIEKL